MPTKTDATTPEGAVRLYLLYLDDPSKLRDESDIKKKEQAVLDAKDPIDKLKAVAERDRAANVDEAPLREGFVKHVKAWAEEQDIPVSAFRELKVSDDVLREAGFDVALPRRRGRGAPGGGQRTKGVSIEDIKAWIANQKGTFVLTDVMSGVGGSPATVRKAVNELIEAGSMEKLGPVPEYSGRGRAPIQYSRS